VPGTFENAAETAIGLQTRGDCGAVYHAISEADVERIMKSPYTMIASDGDIQFSKWGFHTRAAMVRLPVYWRCMCKRSM
jgi:hypothetical protein